MSKKGLQPGELMDPEQQEDYNSPELLAKVTEHLKSIGGNPDPVATPEPSKVGSDPKPEDNEDVPENEDQDIDDSLDESVDSDVEDTEDKDVDKDGKEGDTTIVIPEKLVRAAKHNEWTTEDMTAFWQTNPELAKRTFEKMHTDMINVSNQFAEQGRAARILEQKQTELDQKTAASRASKDTGPKDFVDIEAFEEEYGTGAAAIVKQLNNALKDVVVRKSQGEQVVNVANEQVQVAGVERNLAIIQQVGQWFADKALERYEDYYGKGRDSNGFMLITAEHLTDIQKNHRRELLDKAADIQAGVALRAGTISTQDALTQAHYILTNNLQIENVRKDIMDKAKTRAKGVTLRPNGVKIKPEEKLKPGEKVSEKRLLKNAEARLAKLKAGKPLS